jgi:hypothetical protein
MLLRATPPTALNTPPNRILPSGWIVALVTSSDEVLFTIGLNPGSTSPGAALAGRMRQAAAKMTVKRNLMIGGGEIDQASSHVHSRTFWKAQTAHSIPKRKRKRNLLLSEESPCVSPTQLDHNTIKQINKQFSSTPSLEWCAWRVTGSGHFIFEWLATVHS